ncbi:[protein-PII] uridylyltransferase [Sciscionella sediminilitoris]|uniref:[protein-PII] uridylyltransferase n=1 Tax=Sciscionella sediminilitoris TaxID=1445613 RepID=UPI0004DF2146
MGAGVDRADSAHDVVRVREKLIGQLGGAELRAALTELFELWLAEHARGCGVDREGLALVAVGALGRREMHPYSDLDLLLVHEGRGSRVERIAEALWYPMWDAGIGLDHAVRTVRQACRIAAGDLRTALGLLEARPLAGDGALAERLRTEARAQWRGTARNRVGELAEANAARWARAGELAQRAEPDLKHGRGGLRDVQILRALSLAQLVDRPSAEVLAARDLLAEVRTELHRVTRKPRDVLRAQDSAEVAAALRMGDRFELARAISGAGRTIAYALQVAMRAAGPGPGKAVRRTPLEDGVVLHGGEVALAKGAAPRTDPALLLRVATASSTANAPISAGTLATLAQQAPEPASPWPAAVLRGLLSLLGSGSGLIEVVEALDRTGLWGRLFPEWGAVRDLPPREPPHRYTVDRHLVQTCVQAASLVTTVARPDLLLLGALVHDIGKGRCGDHSVLGARLAAQIGERLGLAAVDVGRLELMVRHHLLLPHTATRRNVADPVTVARVAEAVGGDVVLLELLRALTEADSLATGPGMWSEWKQALVAELVDGVRAAIAGTVPAARRARTGTEDAVLRRAREHRGIELVLEPGAADAELTIAAPDRPGLLSRIAGTLVLHGVRMHAATVGTEDRFAVQSFTVGPRFGSLPDPAALRETLRLAVTGSLKLADRVAAKERDYPRPRQESAPAHVLWFDDEASDATVLELRAIDSVGLLYHATAALEQHDLDVRWARASTLGPTAFLAVCLVDGAGARPGPGLRARVEAAVLAAVRESA